MSKVSIAQFLHVARDADVLIGMALGSFGDELHCPRFASNGFVDNLCGDCARFRDVRLSLDCGKQFAFKQVRDQASFARRSAKFVAGLKWHDQTRQALEIFFTPQSP